MALSLRERLVEKLVAILPQRIQYQPSPGCWLWQGSVKKSGYAVLRIGGPGTEALHRVAFALWQGRWPHAHLQVRHLCHNKRCVAPWHLAEGTGEQNRDDERTRGLGLPVRWCASCRHAHAGAETCASYLHM